MNPLIYTETPLFYSRHFGINESSHLYRNPTIFSRYFGVNESSHLYRNTSIHSPVFYSTVLHIQDRIRNQKTNRSSLWRFFLFCIPPLPPLPPPFFCFSIEPFFSFFLFFDIFRSGTYILFCFPDPILYYVCMYLD
jgi:hypothetical protein